MMLTDVFVCFAATYSLTATDFFFFFFVFAICYHDGYTYLPIYLSIYLNSRISP